MAHRYESWGRTRRPKNVHGATSTAHAISGTAYSTENQRFLHIVCGTTASATKVEVYYHGAGIWSELVEVSDESTIVVADGKTRIFEIAGADKVRVTHNGENDEAAEKVWLLLSTF